VDRDYLVHRLRSERRLADRARLAAAAHAHAELAAHYQDRLAAIGEAPPLPSWFERLWQWASWRKAVD
jgi:hypothetical protein